MNAWISVIRGALSLFGANPDTDELYTKLYKCSLGADTDCGGIITCNYMAGEGVTHLDEGRPIVLRRPDSNFTLENFMRSQLYATMATLKIGMDILTAENVKIDSLTGHGGLFKTPLVGQKYMAAACNAPITCMETAGEGGPYGMALLAAYADMGGGSLEDFLENRVFKNAAGTTIEPNADDVRGFNEYLESFKSALAVEKRATEVL